MRSMIHDHHLFPIYATTLANPKPILYRPVKAAVVPWRYLQLPLERFDFEGAVVFVDIRAHVIFKGRVQGVNFRASTKEVAAREGVVGWVRNLPDGSVEAVIEGPEASVMKVVELCKTSFPRARVDSAEVETKPAKGAFDKFYIRR